MVRDATIGLRRRNSLFIVRYEASGVCIACRIHPSVPSSKRARDSGLSVLFKKKIRARARKAIRRANSALLVRGKIAGNAKGYLSLSVLA